MIIKKFVAKTEDEATEAAKKELGNGVVIMNVREVKAKGLFASLRPKWKEVTVALEGEQEKFSPLQKDLKICLQIRKRVMYLYLVPKKI